MKNPSLKRKRAAPLYLAILRDLALCCYENESDAALEGGRLADFNIASLAKQLAFHLDGNNYGLTPSGRRAAQKTSKMEETLRWARFEPRAVLAIANVRSNVVTHSWIMDAAHVLALIEDGRRAIKRACNEAAKPHLDKAQRAIDLCDKIRATHDLTDSRLRALRRANNIFNFHNNTCLQMDKLRTKAFQDARVKAHDTLENFKVSE